ncbi:MAG: pyruvate kinase [Elusimicrobia bacterium]|nr:pyruvate kinase [Elusimicrobiota bacterium]
MSTSTQILATIGPASIDRIRQMYESGLSGVRINSSHGDINQHSVIIDNTRKISGDIFIVYDIKGPKIRVGDLAEPVLLKAGMEIPLVTVAGIPEKVYPSQEDAGHGIPVTYSRLHEYVAPGQRLLMDDGHIGLRVKKVEGRNIVCEVMYGGLLRSRKGINHPDTVIDFPYTSEEDVPLLEFAVKKGVDYIADSFSRNGADVEELRSRLAGTGIRIISKIENPEGVRNFDDILEKTDAVMIARGDLGVELDPWEVPELQKVFTEKCMIRGKPVIVATQMLESMIDDPRPKRADVSDIANAIYDGADVLMLSGETSNGNYPVLCVEMMRKIIDKTESTPRYTGRKKVINGLLPGKNKST